MTKGEIRKARRAGLIPARPLPPRDADRRTYKERSALDRWAKRFVEKD